MTGWEIQAAAYDDFYKWQDERYPDGCDKDIIELAEEYAQECERGDWFVVGGE